jgi:hypothetical protein
MPVKSVVDKDDSVFRLPALMRIKHEHAPCGALVVVLMQESYNGETSKGVVVHSNHPEYWMGYSPGMWCYKHFEPYYGKVTLENE